MSATAGAQTEMLEAWVDDPENLSLPVHLAPRKGKYYGTKIFDATDREIASIWTAKGEPSEREKQYFGCDWTPEAWADYVGDSHWECARDYEVASKLVTLINAALPAPPDGAEGGTK